MSKEALAHFSSNLLAWFDLFGRKDLPWQHPRSAYRVWVSEIMLQQTQVKTVIPYFKRFMAAFPDIISLAAASEDEVLSKWAGLGYYSRGRNILKTAKIICSQYNGDFPNDLPSLIKLPGIGPSTAAAITSQAFNLPDAILDGNVKRVLCRYFLVNGRPEQTAIKKKLWTLAEQCMPQERCADYTQAIMDLGATCCTNKKPDCLNCPLNTECKAYLQDKVPSYPQKSLKKKLPLKRQQFLLMHRQGDQIYLEKRPPVGIWGGLWCLPIIEDSTIPLDFIQQNYKVNGVTMQELGELKHKFTHFHLLIKTIAVQVELSCSFIFENTGKWYKLSEINKIGLPKPVQMIIGNYIEFKVDKSN